MQLFIHEFVSSGLWLTDTLSQSLASEGVAMLRALLCDLSRIDDCRVSLTWDVRLGDCPFKQSDRLKIKWVSTVQQANETIDNLIAQCDFTLVIAPELDGILEKQCFKFRKKGAHLLNCSPSAIQLCSDKLTFFEHCNSLNIPTPLSSPITSKMPWNPCVVKRRDGAGSTEMQCISSRENWDQFLTRAQTEYFLVQPVIEGCSLSAAAIFKNGQLIRILPVAEQRISADGSFRYLGGAIPVSDPPEKEIHRLIHLFSDSCPGLHGYVGFDFIKPATSETLLMEVNPRLTTSYVGYQQLCSGNLMEEMLGLVQYDPLVFKGKVQFHADGSVESFTS